MHRKAVAVCYLTLPATRCSILDGATGLVSIVSPIPGTSVSPGAALWTSFQQGLAAVSTASWVERPAGDPLVHGVDFLWDVHPGREALGQRAREA